MLSFECLSVHSFNRATNTTTHIEMLGRVANTFSIHILLCIKPNYIRSSSTNLVFILWSFGFILLFISHLSRYPDATPEELASMDNVCIICREDMNTACKKLPCNHIFHTSCLRSWFQRQQTCPTCRMDVLRASVRQIQQPPAQQPQQPQQPQANNMPQPGQGK